MKPWLAGGFLAVLVFASGYASGYAQNPVAPRDQQATVYLQIHKVSPHGGTIKGLYNGTAVDGTFTGGASEGTFTLMANGMVLANGTYLCNPSGCTFSGR